MVEIISAILPYIPPNAISLVSVIIVYIVIQSKRKNTKEERDKDSSNIHDTLLRHEFEITNLKGISNHHEEVLEDLRTQLSLLNTNLVKFSVEVENLAKHLEK